MDVALGDGRGLLRTAEAWASCMLRCRLPAAERAGWEQVRQEAAAAQQDPAAQQGHAVLQRFLDMFDADQ